MGLGHKDHSTALPDKASLQKLDDAFILVHTTVMTGSSNWTRTAGTIKA